MRMIRYYAAHGLLEPRRGSNGYREFTEDDVRIVEGIRCLLASGLNVVEARRVLEVDCGENPTVHRTNCMPHSVVSRNVTTPCWRTEPESIVS